MRCTDFASMDSGLPHICRFLVGVQAAVSARQEYGVVLFFCRVNSGAPAHVWF